jgi:hypothetical protein
MEAVGQPISAEEAVCEQCVPCECTDKTKETKTGVFTYSCYLKKKNVAQVCT